jgi:hypothetical protein
VASSHSGWREVNFPAAIVAILMAILIVVVVQLMGRASEIKPRQT